MFTRPRAVEVTFVCIFFLFFNFSPAVSLCIAQRMGTFTQAWWSVLSTERAVDHVMYVKDCAVCISDGQPCGAPFL